MLSPSNKTPGTFEEKKAEQNGYRLLLWSEFERRRGRNPNYSLRAFSRDIRISPQMLSHVFNGRRCLSPQLVKAIASRVFTDQEQKKAFYYAYIEDQVDLS